ncbi:MAG: protein kinase, partial [Deltaproteobacteria bacterium]|nr:protein kinase [Deltaproteobacteria bacterium]
MRSWRAYQIIEALGEGSWGKVYLAEGPQGRVALKFLRPELGDKVRRHFQGEVRLLSRLSHPNLVKIYDYDAGTKEAPSPENPGPAFAMEFLAGRDLEQLPEKPSSAQLLDLFSQTCRGLAYLHQRQIFHRDLKPSNLFLTLDGKIKILDFGLAIEGSRPTTETQIGTFAFTAPEAYLGDYDARSDLFSLGALFYKIAGGRFPFSRPLLPATLQEFPTPPPLQSLRPELPDYFCELLHRLISPVPAERPASAGSLLKFLALHGQGEEDNAEAEAEPWDEKIPLVGRQEELAVFQDFLRQERGSRGPKVLMITGPTGIGRSRLLEEFKWQALLQGHAWLALRSEDAGAWIERLRRQLDLPDFSADLSVVERNSKLLEALERNPRILAFSDIQDWPKTARDQLALFFSLAKEKVCSVLSLVEWNSDRLATGELEERIHGIDLISDTLGLPELDPISCLEFLKLAAGDRKIPSGVLEQIAEASGGRPILALEGLREASTGARTPATLREVAQQQLLGLDENARLLLALLCLHPLPVSMEQVAGLEARADLSFEDSLILLQQRGLLTLRGDDVWQIRHGALIGAYGEALQQGTRRRAHELWLRYLQSQPLPRRNSPDSLQASVHHALAVNDKAILSAHGIEALQILEGRGELKQMLAWSEELLAIPDLDIDRVWLFAIRAPALYRLGRYNDALEAYRQWREIREDDGSGLVALRYHYYRGLVYFSAGERERSEEELQLALQAGNSRSHPDLRPWQARTHNLLAALAEKDGNPSDAHAHLLSALALAQSDPALLGETEQRLGVLEQSRLHYEAAELHFKNALTEYRQVKNPQVEAIALNFLAMLERERGALAAAETWIQQAIALSREGGELLQYARYLGNLGLLQIERGKLGAARESLQESQTLVSALGHSEDKAVMAIAWTLLFSQAGNRPQSEKWLRKLDLELGKIQNPELQGARTLLEAEISYGREAWDEARLAYLACETMLGATRILGDHARLGLLKTAARTGDAKALQEALINLEARGASRGSAAALLAQYFPFLTKPAEAQAKEDFRGLLASLKSLENPFQRRDFLLILAVYFARGGLAKIGGQIFLAYREESEQIRNHLPEEMKMDFEKNQSLRSLEEALEGNPNQAKRAETIAPSEKIPASSARSQISETRFRQFCEINRQISEKTDLNDILERVMDAAIELTGAERGFLLLKDDKQKSEPFRGFQIKTARRIKHQAIKEDEFQFSLSAVKEAFVQGVPLVTNNASLDPRFQEMRSVVQYQLKSILVVPLEVA